MNTHLRDVIADALLDYEETVWPYRDGEARAQHRPAELRRADAVMAVLQPALDVVEAAEQVSRYAPSNSAAEVRVEAHDFIAMMEALARFRAAREA